MKLGLYPLREWGWLWIILGVVWSAAPLVMEHAPPDPLFVLLSVLAIAFGVLGWPAMQRLRKGQL